MTQTSLPDAPHYHAYLLRFWTEPAAEPGVRLRMMLINLHTGERQGFASLERLFAFLEQQTDVLASGNEKDN